MGGLPPITPCPEECPSPASSTTLVVALASARHDVEAPRSLPDQTKQNRKRWSQLLGQNKQAQSLWGLAVSAFKEPGSSDLPSNSEYWPLEKLQMQRLTNFWYKEAAAPPPAQPRRGHKRQNITEQSQQQTIIRWGFSTRPSQASRSS